MEELTLGEFRGWLDHERRGFNSARGVDRVRMYRRVAAMPRGEERAYCVRAGLERGIVSFRFGYRSHARARPLWLAGVPSMRLALLRPFVVCGACVCDTVDVFPDWPSIPRRALRTWNPHTLNYEAHLDDYFAHFAPDGLDRRSLLWAAGVSR